MAQTDCPICGGSGWKVVERALEGGQTLASAESAYPTIATANPKPTRAVPCDCTVIDPTDRTERALSRARIPERYRLCCFESFETDWDYSSGKDPVPKDLVAAWNMSLSSAKMQVEAFVRDFPACEDMGLILMGVCGVGKTHLAVAALKAILENGHQGLFYDYGELLKLIQSTYSSEAELREMDVLAPVLKCDLLLLDDVGSSKPGMWALETVGHILTSRYNERRFTLITTNYLDPDYKQESDRETDRPRGKEEPPPDLSRSRFVVRLPSGEYIAKSVEDSFEQRVGWRVRSRLYEMCKTIFLISADQRKYRRTLRV